MIGLHENVNILYNIERADYIWKKLSQCQPPEGGMFRRRGSFLRKLIQWNLFTDNLYAGSVRYDDIEVIALDLLDRLPEAFEIWRVKEMLQMKLCPTGVVLLQELQRFNALVEEIENTLQLLRKVSRCRINIFFFIYLIFRIG